MRPLALALLLLASGLTSAAPPTYLDRSVEDWASDLTGEDRDVAIRRLIAGQGDAVPVLFALLDEDEASGIAGRIIQEELTVEAVPALSATTRRGGRPALIAAIRRMEVAPTVEHGRELVPFLEERELTWWIGRALSALGSEAIPLLRTRIVIASDGREGASTDGQTLGLLAQLGPAAAPALPVVLEHLDSRSASLRVDALRAVAGMGPAAAPAVPRLVRLVRETDSHRIRARAIAALAAIGPAAREAIPTLILGLSKDGLPEARGGKMASLWTSRREAARALAVLGDEARVALPAIEAALRDRVDVAVPFVKLGGDPTIAVSLLLRSARQGEPPWGPEWSADGAPAYYEAIETIGELGPAAASAVPALTRMLAWPEADPLETEARRPVILALARIGPAARSAIPALEPLLEVRSLAFYAALALWRVGGNREKALATIASFLESDESWSDMEAVRTLEYVGREARHALPLIVALLDTRFPDEAIAILARLGPDAAPAVPDLVAILDSPWSERRRGAARALGAIGPSARAAVTALVPMLHAHRSDLRAAACRALGRIGGGTAGPAIARLLESKDEEVATAAASALAGIGAEAVGPILDLAQDASDDQESRALEVLVRIEDLHGATVSALLGRLTGTDGGARARARRILGRMGSRAAWGLGRIAARGEPRLRLAAAKALLGIAKEAEDAVPPLAVAFRSPEPELAAAAAEALAAIGFAAVNSVVEILDDEDGSPAVRRRAAEWLAPHAHGYYARNALERAAKDPDAELRAAALTSLAEGARRKK